MKTETASRAKIQFGRILTEVTREPILIEKSGRKVAVVLSFEEYESLKKLEDLYWINKAQKSESFGFIGTKASRKFLDHLLNAKD